MNTVAIGIGAFVLATLVEGLTEYVFADVQKVQPYLKYIALVLGVGAAIAYRVDILAALGLVSPIPFVGEIVSGLIIGRGSNYVNDIVTSFQQPKLPAPPQG